MPTSPNSRAGGGNQKPSGTSPSAAQTNGGKKDSQTTSGIGVYAIRNKLNTKIYIGSTVQSFKERWRLHIKDLRFNKHHSRHLQASWNKYGADSFEFLIVEECAPENCLVLEQYYIDLYESYNENNGYNINPIAASSFGVKRSAETIKKMVAANLGRKASEETKIKMGESQTEAWKDRDRRVSQEKRELISRSLTGRTLTTEHIKAVSRGNMGRIVSYETRRKISAAHMGKVQGPPSAETRAKLSVALKGKKRSEEFRRKMSEIAKNRSAETRAKLSAATKATYQKLRDKNACISKQ